MAFKEGEVLDASANQRFKLAQMFQQLFKQDPMQKKIGGYASALILEAIRFQLESLPLKPKKVVKKIEMAGVDEEDWEEKEYFIFRVKWNHPVIEYSTEIVHEIPVEDFEII
jgi:hypothetical protein